MIKMLKIKFEVTPDWDNYKKRTETFDTYRVFRKELSNLRNVADVRNIKLKCLKCKKWFDANDKDLCPECFK